ILSDDFPGLEGQSSPDVVDGYWVFVAPLSMGDHTIEFDGFIPEANFGVDITYNITVVPGENEGCGYKHHFKTSRFVHQARRAEFLIERGYYIQAARILERILLTEQDCNDDDD
ncbi:MAG: hypothetical protein ACFCD0_12545, partial [Gemmataceae bacterium]